MRVPRASAAGRVPGECSERSCASPGSALCAARGKLHETRDPAQEWRSAISLASSTLYRFVARPLGPGSSLAKRSLVRDASLSVLCVCESLVAIRSIHAGFDAPAAFAAAYQQVFFHKAFGMLNVSC